MKTIIEFNIHLSIHSFILENKTRIQNVTLQPDGWLEMMIRIMRRGTRERNRSRTELMTRMAPTPVNSY